MIAADGLESAYNKERRLLEDWIGSKRMMTPRGGSGLQVLGEDTEILNMAPASVSTTPLETSSCLPARPPTFNNLDPYAKPPEPIRDLYKYFQRNGKGQRHGRKPANNQKGPNKGTGGRGYTHDYVPQLEQVVDLTEEAVEKVISDVVKIREEQRDGQGSDVGLDDALLGVRLGPMTVVNTIPIARLTAAFNEILSTAGLEGCDDRNTHTHTQTPPLTFTNPVPVWEHTNLPGLLVIPGLLPAAVQVTLLNRMMHTDLQNQTHQTNLHAHYKVEYPVPKLDSCVDGMGIEMRDSFFSKEVLLGRADNGGDGIKRKGGMVWMPKDPDIHRSLDIETVLEKKLRWVTFGGQYDWTRKVYPGVETGPEGTNRAGDMITSIKQSSSIRLNTSLDRARIAGLTPTFPPPVATLVSSLFPPTVAEAAILNLYCPGDTLSLHRDVSEFCDRPLVSWSFGCECIFVVGVGGGVRGEKGEDQEEETDRNIANEESGGGGMITPDTDGNGYDKDKSSAAECIAIRLRSGDALVMSGSARFAWHGVPVIIPNTCPDYLADWPARPEREQGDEVNGDTGGEKQDEYEHWRGWMGGKRINLNVRQMWA